MWRTIRTWLGLQRPMSIDGEPIRKKRLQTLHQLEKTLGVRFSDLELLNQALIHRSFLNGKAAERIQSNERMEFLGDSVLGLVVNEHLYRNRPTENEGNLTKIKSLIVSRQILAEKAEQTGLGRYLLLSASESEAGGRKRTSIIADALEAVIGAIYLDQGLEASRRFIKHLILDELLEITQDADHINYKSLLQEKVQSEKKVHPVYRIRREQGPDHEKTFHVEVTVAGRTLGQGGGRTKKEAEQSAARAALRHLNRERGGRSRRRRRPSTRQPKTQ
ncbi:MAG: ribonuclease III [Candidatus Eisenbacteria bacterium]|nr:ribonuclease III [Candidatus Eisenbacteria bacterium]